MTKQEVITKLKDFLFQAEKMLDEDRKEKQRLSRVGIADLSGFPQNSAESVNWFSNIERFVATTLPKSYFFDNVKKISASRKSNYKAFDEMRGVIESLISECEEKNDDYFIESNTSQLSKGSTTRSLKKFDVFISHASSDKIDFVDELFFTVKKLGINIFYDSTEIEWGDNWKRKIIDGVSNAEFALIIISSNFFGREWTERELSDFLARQNASGQKVVLPLLHQVSIADMKNAYPDLSDIQVIESSNYNNEQVAILLAKLLIKRLKEY